MSRKGRSRGTGVEALKNIQKTSSNENNIPQKLVIKPPTFRCRGTEND